MELDILVELQDQYSNIYPLSPTGARGWIRARRETSNSDPEVYIEWDRSHWRYHGEADGWTFEHHFRPIIDDGILMPEMPNMSDILAEAQHKVDAEKVDSATCAHCGGAVENSFLDRLMEAQEVALESDGYLIITLTPRQEGQMMIYEPKVYLETLNETARQLLEIEVVHLASHLFRESVFQHIEEIEGDEQ